MRVDFYILQGEANRELFACRLCEKAFQQQLAVYLHAQSAVHAEQIDNLLWTFNDGGFLPHQLTNQKPHTTSPLPALIGWEQAPPDEYSLLINLADAILPFHKQFERVAEIVNQQEQVKKLGRERFSFYRQQGYDLQHHEL